MGGCTKTSTQNVTARAPHSPCSKLKMETASAATPAQSGHLHLITVSMLMIVVRCCSTCLAKGTSQTKEQASRYCVTAVVGLVLVEMAGGS